MAQLITADILSDIPAREDKLDFEPYAKTVRDIILNPSVATPLTIGIFGSWGSGKSSLMKMIEKRLKPEIDYTIWFNAWVYNKEDALWRALITQVLHGVEKLYADQEDVTEEVETVLEQLYQATELTDLGSLSITASNLLNEKDTGSAQFSLTLLRGLKLLDKVHSESDNQAVENVQEKSNPVDPAKLRELRSEVRRQMATLERGRITSLEEFRQQFSQLINKYFANTGIPLVVFVDDLDRCLPEKAVEVLEAIKLFLDAPGCIFILAIDQDVVERGIKLRYGELGIDTKNEEENNGIGIDGRRYLEKIIQIPFNLPPISRESIARFIAQEAPNLPNPECGQVFAVGLEPNPRQVKRSINIFSLLWSLSRHKSEVSNLVSEVRLAKLVVLQQRFHTLYAILPEAPEQIIEWEKAFREIQKANESDPFFNWRGWLETNKDEPGMAEPPITLMRTHHIELDDLVVLAELLTMYPDTTQFQDWNFSSLEEEQIKPYIFLTSTSSTTGTPTGQSTAAQGAVVTPPPIMQEEKPGEKGFEIAQPGDDNQQKQVAVIETGLDSRRRAYILESTFGELTRLSHFVVQEKEDGMKMMDNLANVGSRFFNQVFGAYDQLELLGSRLANAKTLSVSPQADEYQIPWEIVYDHDSTAPTTSDGFWGFRYSIDRPSIGDVTTHEIRVTGKPLVKLGMELDFGSPLSNIEEKVFRDFVEKGTIETEKLSSPEDFFTVLESNRPPHIVVLNGKAGIDGEEAWIDFVSNEDSSVDSRELANILSSRFDGSELEALAFELSLQLDNLSSPNQPIKAKSRDLVLYMERRGRLGELVETIKRLRPDITFNQSTVRINRQALERAKISRKRSGPGNSLLYLNVDAAIGRSTDWNHWVSLLGDMGFGGVIVPLIPSDPSWSGDFMWHFMKWFILGGDGPAQAQGGVPVGQALLMARKSLFEHTSNPLGLAFAYFGIPDLQLTISPTE